MEPEALERQLKAQRDAAISARESNHRLQACHWRLVSGPVRSLVWRLAAQAGLRGEISALQVRDMETEAHGGAMLTVRAETAKNRTEARLPLAADLAHDLAPYAIGKLPTTSLPDLPRRFKASRSTRRAGCASTSAAQASRTRMPPGACATSTACAPPSSRRSCARA